MSGLNTIFSFKKLVLLSFICAVLFGLIFLTQWNHVFAQGTIELISKSQDGIVGDDDSLYSIMSDNGRFVAFSSSARNLDGPLPNNNHFGGVYVKDRLDGSVKYVSLVVPSNSPPGTPEQETGVHFDAPVDISANGTKVTWAGTGEVYVRDLDTNTTKVVSLGVNGTQANNFSGWPTITPDGNKVVFVSRATNLDPNYDQNNLPNAGLDFFVYVRDLQTDQTTLVSLNSSNLPTAAPPNTPSISDNGQFVVFGNTIRDIQNSLSSTFSCGSSDSKAKISGNGDFIVFFTLSACKADDENNKADVYLFDRALGTYELISVNSSDIIGNFNSINPDISFDGRFVVFESFAENFFPSDQNNTSDIFLRDRLLHKTEMLSLKNDGTQSNGPLEDQKPTLRPYISRNARFVSFEAYGPMVSEDTNGQFHDVYLVDRGTEINGADLSISMIDSPDPITPRSELTYSIIVTNQGSTTATNVTLTDNLPSGPEFISAIASQGSCSGTTAIICNFGSISSGNSVSVDIKIKPRDVGTFANTAYVNADQSDFNSADNFISEGTTVASAQDLSKLKVAIQGNGTVTSNPVGINCHPNCLVYFFPGTQVTLTATPLPGYDFIGWDFDCAFAGTNTTCTLTANSSLTAKAKFTRR